jgi:excisionase family DNA binding protein
LPAIAQQETRMSELLMTIKEAGVFLKVNPNTVHNLCKNGHLTRIKVGRSTRISKSEVMAMLQKSDKSNALDKALGL